MLGATAVRAKNGIYDEKYRAIWSINSLHGSVTSHTLAVKKGLRCDCAVLPLVKRKHSTQLQ